MKLRLGIIGGIGSGKSTICKVFEVLGIPVFYSDDEARKIMDSSEVVRKGLFDILGFDIYVDGQIDRPRMAGIIFNDNDLLQKVNKLVHPLVFEEFEAWIKRQNSDYVILESAILLESNAEWMVEKLCAVIAPLEERITRVMDRNNLKREEVMERIRNQVSENEMVRRSDFFIDNSDTRMIIPQVLSVHNDLNNLINNI